ncbi:MAG: hypothetical protein AAB676_00410 [Verrucomicrobiota bacterium]
MAGKTKTNSKSGDTSSTTRIARGGMPPVPRPLFIVFCRICGIETLPTDQLAAAQRVLLDVCEEAKANPDFQVFAVHSSVYGRFLGCRTAAQALDAAQHILSKAAEQGVHLAIGVAGDGRLEWFDDLGMRPNLVGIPINAAARLAFIDESENSIMVEPFAANEAQKQRAGYKSRFGKEVKEQVKRTHLTFRVLKFSAEKFGDLPKSRSASETQVTVAVYDIVRYSEKDVEEAWKIVDGLRREVVEVLQSLNGERMVNDKELWYSPAGDGGVLVFASHHADKAFEFVEKLAERCRKKSMEIRLAVADGTVVIIGDSLPVGKGIVSADKLCGHPATWRICARKSYFSGLSKSIRQGWVTSEAPNNADAWLLSPPGTKDLESGKSGRPSGDPAKTFETNFAQARAILREAKDFGDGLEEALRREFPESTRNAADVVGISANA